MTVRRPARFAPCSAVLALLLAAAAAPPAQAQAQAQTAPDAIYRCGNGYSSTPCPGGRAVLADDARSEAQRQQALAARQQDAQLATGLAAERQARERAAAGQTAARIGPSPAERERAEAAAARKQAHATAKQKKQSSKPRKSGKRRSPAAA